MPDNPRIPVPPTANPVYITNAFLQAPGKYFWESPGRVRRSGAIPPSMLSCVVTAVKAIHGTHPAYHGYSNAAIQAAWPAEPQFSYYASVTPTARFSSHQITGLLNGRPRHSLTTVTQTGVPTTDIFWEYQNYAAPPVTDDWTQDHRWMRRRTDFSADAFTTVGADGALNYSFTRDDGTTTLSETGLINGEVSPVPAYDSTRNYVEHYGGPILTQYAGNLGKDYKTVARDFFPSIGYGSQKLDGSGRAYIAGYDEVFNFASYSGVFDDTGFINNNSGGQRYSATNSTGIVGTQIVAGWNYSGAVNETAIAAIRATIKLTTNATEARRILFLLIERQFGDVADTVSVISSIMLAPNQIYDYIGAGGTVPGFLKFSQYRWITAVFG